MIRRWLRKAYRCHNTRQYLRLQAAWPLKWRTRAGRDRQVTMAKDVSAGGIGLVVREMIPVGSPVSVEIHIPQINRTISAEGKVARIGEHRDGFELGIRFMEIDPEDRTVLNEVVERLSTVRQKVRQWKPWWRQIR